MGWPKNAIFCVIWRITLDVNRKRTTLRAVSAIAELLVQLLHDKTMFNAIVSGSSAMAERSRQACSVFEQRSPLFAKSQLHF